MLILKIKKKTKKRERPTNNIPHVSLSTVAIYISNGQITMIRDMNISITGWLAKQNYSQLMSIKRHEYNRVLMNVMGALWT